MEARTHHLLLLYLRTWHNTPEVILRILEVFTESTTCMWRRSVRHQEILAFASHYAFEKANMKILTSRKNSNFGARFLGTLKPSRLGYLATI